MNKPTHPTLVRPVTPYECPKCHALWLFWPKEQTGFDQDHLNLKSPKSCNYCEPAGVEALNLLGKYPVKPVAVPNGVTQKKGFFSKLFN